MRKKAFFLAALLVIFAVPAFAVTGESSENLKLHLGEKQSIGDYVFSYGVPLDEKVFKIGVDREDSLHIIHRYNGEEVYEIEGKSISLDQNTSFSLEDTGYDDGGLYIELAIEGNRGFFTDLDISSNSPSRIIIPQGGSTSVDLELNNNGLKNETFSLGDVNSSLETWFEHQDFNVSRVHIPSKEKKTVTATIEVPENFEPGLHSVNIRAWNSSSAQEEILLDVKKTEEETRGRDLDMDVEELYKRVKPGKTVSIPVEFSSRGSKSVENINVTVVPPDGWSQTVDNDLITLSGRGYDRETATVNLEAPRDADSGDYFAEISAESEQVSVEEEEVRIQVKKKSGLSYLGLVLMLISVGLLAFVYRKFSRR